MNVGIIGFGSMGKMLAEKFSAICDYDDGFLKKVYVSNRSKEKLINAGTVPTVCNDNCELAVVSDIIFVCTRPADIKTVFEEISPVLKSEALLVSLNGSITFEMLEKITSRKMAKVIPSVTAEINRSQTLVCYRRTS